MKTYHPRLTPSRIFKGSFKGNRKTKKGAINSKIINNPILTFSNGSKVSERSLFYPNVRYYIAGLKGHIIRHSFVLEYK